jgi:hypothetical protein
MICFLIFLHHLAEEESHLSQFPTTSVLPVSLGRWDYNNMLQLQQHHHHHHHQLQKLLPPQPPVPVLHPQPPIPLPPQPPVPHPHPLHDKSKTFLPMNKGISQAVTIPPTLPFQHNELAVIAGRTRKPSLLSNN